MSKTQTETKHRLLKISILRYNPQDPDSVPHMQTYELEEGDRMTLFIAPYADPRSAERIHARPAPGL